MQSKCDYIDTIANFNCDYRNFNILKYRNSLLAKFCVRNIRFRKLQACAIYSLHKLVQVNYFRVKKFRYFEQNKIFNENFAN